MKYVFIPLALVIISLLFVVDNYLRVGVWFDLGDIHHETFTLVMLSLAFAYTVLSNEKNNK